jgi:two-component system response regulator FixJ
MPEVRRRAGSGRSIASERSEPAVEFTSARPVVAIVDDDPAVRNALAFSLETDGITVRAYSGSAELLTAVPRADCFVIDFKLPGMDGLELLAELRRRRIASPAILITTHPSASVRERAAIAGAALIEKPLLDDALFREICAALGALGDGMLRAR